MTEVWAAMVFEAHIDPERVLTMPVAWILALCAGRQWQIEGKLHGQSYEERELFAKARLRLLRQELEHGGA